MSIALSRRRIGMAEKAADYFKTEATRDKMGRVGVSVVVKAILADLSFHRQ